MPPPVKKFESDNAQWKSITPEEMVACTWYTITLNPKNQFFDETATRHTPRLAECIDYLYECLAYLKNVRIELYPEISSLGRVHYHGILKVYDIFEFYLKDIPMLKDICSFEIDKIDSMETWIKYCTKQKSIMEKHSTVKSGKAPRIVRYPLKYHGCDYEEV